MNSRFNTLIGIRYSNENFEEFLTDFGNSNLDPQFFIESNVYEYLINPVNEQYISRFWKKVDQQYQMKDEFLKCLVSSTDSQDFKDIVNSLIEVPDVSPSLLAVSLNDGYSSKELDAFALNSFLSMYLFGQTALNLQMEQTRDSSEPTNQKLFDGDSVYTEVEIFPEFEGGMTGFYQYLGDHLSYPKQARKLGVEGKVFVQFIVSKTGDVVDVQIVKGIGSGCDEEAMRAVNHSPKWSAGRVKGKPVHVRLVVPIIFNLRDENT